MNQQSEHLSNAQIEQYGKRASGAGSETEAWVEQHLDDCSSCRSRVLDFQRTRFALLPNPKVNKVSTSDCPSEDDLRKLAAGLYTDSEAAQLKAHAATCNHCGPLLQQYIEDFSDETSPEEQAFLNQLRTSSPEFREQKAREMFELNLAKKNPVIQEPVSSTDWRRFFSWKWILVPALPAVALIAVGIWFLQRDTPERVQKLLAQAYTEQRTMDMRWPGAKWAQRLPQERGGAVKQSATLFEAKSSILKNVEKNSEDWRWLHELGAQELLEHRLDEAVADLRHALQLRSDSTAIMLDLATAHFQRGKATQNSDDYRQAVELLGKVLEAEPNNTVALFNRAILYEEMSPPLYDLAIRDWDRYLGLDQKGPWHNEAQNRKSQLEQTKKKVS